MSKRSKLERKLQQEFANRLNEQSLNLHVTLSLLPDIVDIGGVSFTKTQINKIQDEWVERGLIR